MASVWTEPEPLKGRKLLFAAFSLALANFVVVLDVTIANVSLSHIAGGLAVSPTQGTWVITSYSVADAISVPLTGWLAARFGTVRWFLMSLAGFATFSFMCGISGTLSALVIFRILQGLSGGPLMPLTQALLVRIFPPEKRTIGVGIWAMTTTAAPIIGPILGGYISDNWTWPWIFFINLPIIALVFFAVSRQLKPFETPIVRNRIDLVGLALLILTVGAFQLMLDTGRELDWFGSARIVTLAIVAAIGFVAFVIWELTEENPIVDIRIFRHRGFAVATTVISMGYGAFFSIVVLTPLWLQSTLGYTATNSGFVVAWIGLFAVLISPIAARVSGKADARIIATVGLVWIALVTLLRLNWTSNVDYWTLVIPHILHGIGMPLFFIALTSLAMTSVEPAETVSAAGLMSFTRTLSGAIAAAVATTSWDNAGRVARSQIVGQMNDVSGAMRTLGQTGMGQEQARAAIDRMVEVQASTLALLHIYLIVVAILLAAAAVIWFAPKPARSGAPIAAH